MALDEAVTQMENLSIVPVSDPKKPATHMSNTFHERIARGNNLTKMGNASSPRDTAMLIAAQEESAPPRFQ